MLHGTYLELVFNDTSLQVGACFIFVVALLEAENAFVEVVLVALG